MPFLSFASNGFSLMIRQRCNHFSFTYYESPWVVFNYRFTYCFPIKRNVLQKRVKLDAESREINFKYIIGAVIWILGELLILYSVNMDLCLISLSFLRANFATLKFRKTRNVNYLEGRVCGHNFVVISINVVNNFSSINYISCYIRKWSFRLTTST